MNNSLNENDQYNIVMADAALSREWRERFEFFRKYGAPNSPEFHAAYKAFSRGEKRLINKKVYQSYGNSYGHFLGPVYFLVLGMWRRALTLTSIGIGIAFVVGVILGVPLAGLSLAMLWLFLSFASLPGLVIVLGGLMLPIGLEDANVMLERRA